MPELPEVETVVRQLRPHILNKQITRMDVFRPGQWKQTDHDEAIKRMIGNSFIMINRRAKFINIFLENDFQLVIHLRMSGKLIWQPTSELYDKYTRALIIFDDNSSLQFNDTRALGTIDLYPPACLPKCLEKLGIEPLSEDFNRDILTELLSSSRLEIKDFLMNQSKVCGIGNIYANEILFSSKIHPRRIANSLITNEIDRLTTVIPDVLCASIERMGTSLGKSPSDYRTIYNVEGEFQKQLTVYGRTGEPCVECGSEIRRIVQKGRSSFFCEKCQQ